MFLLDDNSPLPFYKQLYNQIRVRILSGDLAADFKLPSVRELAAQLSTSRNTVDGAYQELYAEGFIYSRERSGYFVSALDQEAGAPPAEQLTSRSREPKAPPRLRWDFHPARLDPQSFPVSLWRKCYTTALNECAGTLGEYADRQGEWALRNEIRQYLERSRGVTCEEEQIVVTAGLQHSLELVAHLVRDRHDAVALENPGYHLPGAVFENNGFRLSHIDVHPSGIDIDRLKASGSSIVYVTPSHQLPMGCVMPVANRLRLLEWAGNDKLILEDDYDSELRYHGKPISSLQGLRPGGNVVYLGTFSKVLSPTLRLAYLVLPQVLLSSYRARYRDYFSTAPLLEQRAMALFMREGHWERHLRRMRIVYEKKHDALLGAVARHFGDGAAVLGAGAGLHVVLRLLRQNPGEAEILRRAEAKGIRLHPFSQMCRGAEPSGTHLLLGFGGMEPGVVEEGIAIISTLCT